MHHPDPPEPATPGERLLYLFILFLILGLLAAEIIVNYEPVKLSALFFILARLPLLVLHEGGHALMALALNWRVSRMVLGLGKTLDCVRVGGIPVEVRLFPIEGFVTCAPCNLHWPRLKCAFIYFAGPGCELLLAALLLWAVGPEVMFTRTNDLLLIFWQSCALAAVFGAALNLFPHGVYTPGGELVSDGLGIIRSFTTPSETYQLMLLQDELEREWES